jgi:predicted Zn-dependent protease
VTTERTLNVSILRRPPALAGLLLVAGCATNPVTGRTQLSLVSEGQEVAMGQEAAKSAEQSIGLVDNAGLQSYVSQLGMTLARRSQRPNLPWHFGVVDDPTPNAFALPGGPVYVTRGLLGVMNSEAELVSVLGHEIGHIAAKHQVTMISRAQLAQIGLVAGMVLLPSLAQFGDLAGGGLQLLFLRYSRDAERQADDLGFSYTLQSGYDVRDMVKVFEALQRIGEASGQSPLPAWLTTHPHAGERIQRIQQQLTQVQQPLEQTRRNVEPFLARLERLVYGENPRAGFFRGTTFLHPDLRFQLEFPQGWKTQNLTQSVTAASSGQDAIIQLTLAQGGVDQAAQSFFGQQGLESAQVGRTTINGMSAVTGYFQAQTQEGTLAGVAAFISHENRTYQILAFTPAARLRSYESVFRATIGSFARLTDQSALSVQPNRITIVRTTAAMTLSEFNSRFPSRIPIEELALINGLQGPSSRIPAGASVKRIITSS